MPRIYKRKTEFQTFNEASMELAIKACREKEMGYLRASREFNVPICSLRRRVKNKNLHAKENFKTLGSIQQSLPPALEKELERYILEMDKMLFGLSTCDVRKMAYELAVRNNIPSHQHRFNEEKKMAGWGWLFNFRKRFPNLSLRTPEPTSMARATGFSKEKVSEFFRLLRIVYDEHHFTPERIFNVDETGLTNVQGKPSKVFSSRSKRQVGCIKSAERGSNVTIVCAMNVTGMFLPPAFVIPRKRVRAELADHAPPGSLFLYQDRGWMDSEQFINYLKHFVLHVKPTVDSKVLLILDGHHSHKTAQAVEFCHQNGIVLLCLPPHCTHKLQPLDVAFFKSFNSNYDKAVENWLRTHYGRVLTLNQIPFLVSDAFSKSATATIARNGFRATGIFPYDDNIFQDQEFLVAETEMVAQENTTDNVLVIPEEICPLPVFPKPNSKRVSSASILTFNIVDLDATSPHFNNGSPSNPIMNTSSASTSSAPNNLPLAISTNNRRVKTNSSSASTSSAPNNLPLAISNNNRRVKTYTSSASTSSAPNNLPLAISTNNRYVKTNSSSASTSSAPNNLPLAISTNNRHVKTNSSSTSTSSAPNNLH
jgi:hypothetical protein